MSDFHPKNAEEEEEMLQFGLEDEKKKSDGTTAVNLYDRDAMVRTWEENYGTLIHREGSLEEFERWWAWKKGERFESAYEKEKREKKEKKQEEENAAAIAAEEAAVAAEPLVRKRKAHPEAAAKKTKRAKRSWERLCCFVRKDIKLVLEVLNKWDIESFRIMIPRLWFEYVIRTIDRSDIRGS